MGILRQLMHWSRGESSRGNRDSHSTAHRLRICRVEEMESRRLMAADIHIGAVYYEPASGLDTKPNVITLTWAGGAAGTELTHLTIDGMKNGVSLQPNDVIFDTAPGGLGAYGNSPLTIVSHTGFQVLGTPSVVDGSTRINLDFSGFTAGKTLVFTIDADQVLFIDPQTHAVSVDAVDEGAEFERSILTGSFSAPHYNDVSGQTLFWDQFNNNFSAADTQSGSHLSLPPDAYTDPNNDQSVLTAGAVFTARQTPLPSTLAGTVFVDSNLNNNQDAGELGIGGVKLSLWQLGSDGTTYTNTGLTATTDSLGNYQFNNLLPGTYRVVETQPSGYFSVNAKAGTVDGVTDGSVDNPDQISSVTLLGGQDSIHNNFGEYLPNSISGHVQADVNGNCDTDTNPINLAGVQIQLLDGNGSVIQTTTTDNNGNYQFTGLLAGTYGVHEIQPSAYLQGDADVGNAGGAVAGTDKVTRIVLTSGTNGQHYDFCESVPVSISGYVYVDANNNGARDAGEAPIAGVTMHLLDAVGNPTGATTATDVNGYYIFGGLAAGTYGVSELQPAAYLDGLDAAGTQGGTAHNPGDSITGAVLTWGNSGLNYNFGELQPGSISGKIQASATGDCDTDPNPVNLANIGVQLLDAGGTVIATTTTDADGNYTFEHLALGVYSVHELATPGYLDADSDVGTAGGASQDANTTTGITINSGTAGTGYNFCEMIPGSLSGYVFQDGPAILTTDGTPPADLTTVRTGVKVAGDNPIAGVLVTLGDATGKPLLDAGGNHITTTTDATGYYQFTGLAQGVYTVIESQPGGYISSINTPGPKGGLAIDATKHLSPLTLQTFDAAARTDSIVRIPVLGGQNSQNNWFSEVVVQKAPTSPPPPVTPPVTPPGGGEPPLNPPQIMVAPPEFPGSPPFTPAPFGGGADAGRPFSDVSVAAFNTITTGVAEEEDFTWHLSVVNAGFPRGPQQVEETLVHDASMPFDAVSWKGVALDRAQWIVNQDNNSELRESVFGMPGAIPIVGDFAGDGHARMGVFVDGQWFIDLNGNGVWDAGDLYAQLGKTGDIPVVGDWDGDGKDDIGIFGRAWAGDTHAISGEPGLPHAHNAPTGKHKNLPPDAERAAVGKRTLKLTSDGKARADAIDHVFRFGRTGDVPVVGDWTGHGTKTVGVFRDGQWYLDIDGDGKWSPADKQFTFGQPGDIPVVGNFSGDGIDCVGVFRNGTWIIDTTHSFSMNAHNKVFALGGPGDKPVVGDWDGSGHAQFGVYHNGVLQKNKVVPKSSTPRTAGTPRMAPLPTPAATSTTVVAPKGN